MRIKQTENAPAYDYDTIYSFSSNSLIIPLFAKFTFRPSIFDIDIFGGAYIDLPLTVQYKDSFNGTEKNIARNSLFGFGAGGSCGMNLGPGIIYCDTRYMRDFTKTNVVLDDEEIDIYRRNIIAFGIAYKMGFFDIKQKEKK
jgi:hypothetical protein